MFSQSLEFPPSRSRITTRTKQKAKRNVVAKPAPAKIALAPPTAPLVKAAAHAKVVPPAKATFKTKNAKLVQTAPGKKPAAFPTVAEPHTNAAVAAKGVVKKDTLLAARSYDLIFMAFRDRLPNPRDDLFEMKEP